MRKTTRTILLLLVGMALFAAVLVVGFGIWFFTSAIESTVADEAQATESFATVRARFSDDEPVLAMTDSGPTFVRKPPATPPQRDLENIRLIAWDPADRELATVTIPFWLVRMRDGPFSISASTFMPNVRLSIRAAELERYGPAILMDETDEDGGRVLIWTE